MTIDFYLNVYFFFLLHIVVYIYYQFTTSETSIIKLK